jgi:hypothetical protein
VSHYRSSRAFVPSQYSYGGELEEDELVPQADAPPSTTTGEKLAQYAPFLQSLLGLDDSADKAARLKGRLSTLQQGGPGAFVLAKTVCGLCSVDTAIQKTKDQLTAAETEASKAQTRDTMYTALAVTGVAAGSMLVIWMGFKTWGSYQEGQIRNEELKRLKSGG